MSSGFAQRPLRLGAVAAAALALLIAGCGESREQASSTATGASPPPTTAAPAPTTAADFTVTEREFSLDPSNLQVSKTGTFTLAVRNTGSIPHALEVEAPGGEVKTGAIAPGGTAQLRVALGKPGRYEWYCPIGDHKDRGMRGTVVVAGAKTTKPKTGEDRGRRGKGTSGGHGSGDKTREPSGGSPSGTGGYSNSPG